MSYLNRVINALSRGMINSSRTRVRQDLLHRGDRFLADNGFSRQLLEQGNQAWPWRIENSATTNAAQFTEVPAVSRSALPSELSSVDNSFKTAEAELKLCSDSELADLGIARSSIADVVRNGRPGIDYPVNNETGDRKAA